MNEPITKEEAYRALAVVGSDYRSARKNAERARMALVPAVRVAALAGISESEIARQAGVTRMTVRKALGK